MRSWLRGLMHSQTKQKRVRRPASVRPRLEALEDRLTPTLTYHGGAILASVQVQAVYLGSSWTGSTIAPSVFDSFLSTTVSGTTAAPAPYLAMLRSGGFTGVSGAGGALAGVVDGTAAVPSTITDSQIQADLQAEISSSAVQQPNSNTLYEVFVQPGSVVSVGNGETSVNYFLAYHSSFQGTNAAGQADPIRYAVIPFHGTGGNAQDPWLNQQDSMTVAASHELAEAVTDPDGTAYFDRSGNEVGDVVNGSTVYLNGYAVQREGSLPASLFNFLPMTPTGAVASHSDTFTIQGGALAVNGVAVANPSGETGKVAAVSLPGVDDFGQPMVDVVFSDGKAYEYHDFAPVNGQPNPTAAANPSFFPWTSLGGNVKQAAAGQGVSYVLLTNGALGEYVDPNYSTYYYGYGVNPGARNGAIATGVTSILGVGLDSEGVNAVVYSKTVSGKTVGYEWRDVTASASQTSSTNPLGGLKHSELPTTMGAASGANPATPVVVDVPPPSAPILAASVATIQPSQPAAIQAPAAVALPAEMIHAAFPDGGGGSTGEPPAEDHASPPASLGDASVLDAVFTEAVRRLKMVRFAVPEFWPAAPMNPNTPPAPANPGRPPAPAPTAAPQGKGAVPLEKIGLAAVPAAVGLCGVGLECEERRRRERLPERPG